MLLFLCRALTCQRARRHEDREGDGNCIPTLTQVLFQTAQVTSTSESRQIRVWRRYVADVSRRIRKGSMSASVTGRTCCVALRALDRRPLCRIAGHSVTDCFCLDAAVEA